MKLSGQLGWGMVLFATMAQATPLKISPVTISATDLPKASRWMFQPGQHAPKLAVQAQVLSEMRQAQQSSDWVKCVRAGQKALTSAPLVAPWVANSILNCGFEGVKADKLKIESLRTLIARVEKTPEWLRGPQRGFLLRNWVRAALLGIENDLKTNRTRAWSGIESLSKFEGDLSADEKAELFRLAGEILFIEQIVEGAQTFFERSLRAKPTANVRERLRALKVAVADDTTENPSTQKKAKAAVPDSDVSSEEAELVERMTASFKTGDLISAAQDGAKLSRQYPGSSRTQWASERIFESYLNLSAKTEEELSLVKDRFVKQMLKFDDETLGDWAKKMFARGYYADAFILSEKASTGLASSARSTAPTFLAARAALASDQFKEASERFQILVDRHGGTTEATDSLFYLGLLNFRKKNYTQAASFFERLLVLPKTDNWELNARYWLWRSLQRMQNARAGEQAQLLINKFPFSYYGLRAAADLGQELSFKWEPQKTKAKLWLTTAQSQTLKRAELLMQAGWWEESQKELATLPVPTNPQAKALMALVHAQALDYPRAISWLNEAWDQDPTIRNPPFVQATFPLEFAAVMTKHAQALNLDPILVRSLIKQESAFGLRAVSSSNALGLMQMIPPTAQEVAGQLGIKNLKLPEDMFHYETNIRMGSFYLSAMLDRFSQNVPLALAAYNAGPHRLERWLNSRPSLANIKMRLSSQPEDEMWFEELPWSETRFYVKAILRNTLLYRVLAEGRVQVTDPIWKDLVKNRLKSSP